jgi:hypothetical protein
MPPRRGRARRPKNESMATAESARGVLPALGHLDGSTVKPVAGVKMGELDLWGAASDASG